jgi:hemolysin activation/secretion protein
MLRIFWLHGGAMSSFCFFFTELLTMGDAIAQTLPTQDGTMNAMPLGVVAVLAQVSPVEPTIAPSPDQLPFPVQTIEVVDSTLFDRPEFDSVFAEAKQIIQTIEARQTTTTAEMGQLADVITQAYLNQGYITSRAIFPPDQDLNDRVATIRVIEGEIEEFLIERIAPVDETGEVDENIFTLRINDRYIQERLERGTTSPLNQSQLEDQLRLLRLDPLFSNVEASIRRGSVEGKSILIVRVTEAYPFSLSVGVNNYSPPSVGSEQIEIGVTWLSPTGGGDRLSASYTRSTTGGSNLFDFSYVIPFNSLNGTLELRAAPSDYRITDPEFAQFDIQGQSELYELTVRQPLWRSSREEFAVSLGFTYRDGQTLISEFVADNSTTSVLRIGQDYLNRDARGAWAVRSQFNLGLDVLDATARSAGTDGQFFSWLGQVQRVQILNPNNLLIFQVDAQFTPDPLLPSQQFVLGGGQSIRGFRQNIRIGDNGFRLSVEDRFVVNRNAAGEPAFQLAPFADMGSVWNDGGNSTDLPDQTFLAGIGVGLLWQPFADFNLRLDYALPLVDLADRGENIQDHGIYFSVNYEL